MPEPERMDRRRAALIAYDVCRRALTPSDPARRAAMRPVLDAWVQMIAVAREARVPVIYTTLFRSRTTTDAMSRLKASRTLVSTPRLVAPPPMMIVSRRSMCSNSATPVP